MRDSCKVPKNSPESCVGICKTFGLGILKKNPGNCCLVWEC